MSAINEWFGGYSSMFHYIRDTYGTEELKKYLDYLAKDVYDDVAAKFRAEGLAAIEERYVKNFLKDGGDDAVKSERTGDTLVMKVHCPAFHNSPEAHHPEQVCDGFFCDCCKRLNCGIIRESGCTLNIDMETPGDCVWTIKK